MHEPTRTAVIYYSATGNVHRLAEAAIEGARKAGSETRLRKVRELAPDHAISANDSWNAHVEATTDVSTAQLDDLTWADVVIFGAPTRYGNVASQFQQFLDLTGPVWAEGKLANKVYTAFTSSQTPHGGQESTLLSLYTTFYHWGGIVVPPGFTDPVQFRSGNPYGASHVSGGGSFPGDTELEAARYQAHRAVDIATALAAGFAAPAAH
ncbi:NAD(P)H:quinone oxidoreductase, type IV [Saccharomonospora sp. CUA-673]|uniref:NAD(P)H:quinone oxidoreductase n=1 Tax=Saccharomonospora sp. CUA-673 TaxID=1904969 RepID=UPI000962FD39|nr:NAD(P)H:quinone oxidoreductase [Saccharomonospora sp. CUA-673]OLT48236.1 NAD(P)H:quinone oxidoreductase, type IV [Saccharomonospora sp. CUA-673]